MGTKPVNFPDAKAEASPSLVFTSQLYDKTPEASGSGHRGLRLRSGAGSPPARSAVPSSI